MKCTSCKKELPKPSKIMTEAYTIVMRRAVFNDKNELVKYVGSKATTAALDKKQMKSLIEEDYTNINSSKELLKEMVKKLEKANK